MKFLITLLVLMHAYFVWTFIYLKRTKPKGIVIGSAHDFIFEDKEYDETYQDYI